MNSLLYENIYVIFLFFYFIFQWRVLTAPFHHVAFADFWLADQLNSLVVAILDMEYLSCFYALDFYSVQGKFKYHRRNFVFSLAHVILYFTFTLHDTSLT